MAETAGLPPPVPVPAPAARPPKLSGFQPLDARIKELTSSQAELLARIQKLKLEVQNWRSNLETQVKTCHNELVETKQGLSSEVEQLKSEIEEIRSAIQEEKGSLPTPFRDTDESNDESERAGQTQDQLLDTDDSHMDEHIGTQA